MNLTPGEVVQGLAEELEGFHQLIVRLTPAEWSLPSRCEKWTVGDLAAHVTGVFADIVGGRLEGAGTQEWYDRQVAERWGRPPATVAGELAGVIPAIRERGMTVYVPNWDAPAPPGVGGTLGSVTLSLWGGVYLHVEDVLAALDRPAQRGPGLRAEVWYIADEWVRRGWKPVTLLLTGMEEIPLAGGGERISGDPLSFVLAATGRQDPGSVGLDSEVNVYT